MKHTKTAFTLIEIMITISVIAILASVTMVSYGLWGRQTSDSVVKNDVIQATSGLTSYINFQNNYPPNLAGINFAASQGNELTLYTNAPSIGVYSNLTKDQNAQLFLNTCNANLSGLDNTACTFAGNGGGAKIHVKGTHTSNTIWNSPIYQSDVTLPYGPAYTAATNTIISQFLAQGGTFPIIVTGSNVTLSVPTQQPNGPATDYCIEGRSGAYPDVVYHATPSDKSPTSGACPPNANLHYFPPAS